MREKQLSKRLQAVADMVTPGSRVADVGCDHAYVSLYLIEKGIAAECLAMDVNEGPLMRAKENIRVHGLEDRIRIRLGSGLTPVKPGEVDAVLMAGMGGILITELLDESLQTAEELREWILQPQSDVERVRRYIREHGFQIVEENMVKEDGKFYPMFRAVRSTGQTKEEASVWQEVCDRYGEMLLSQKHPVLKEYLIRGKKMYQDILTNLEKNGGERNAERMEERKASLTQEAEYIRIALERGFSGDKDYD